MRPDIIGKALGIIDLIEMQEDTAVKEHLEMKCKNRMPSKVKAERENSQLKLLQ